MNPILEAEWDCEKNSVLRPEVVEVNTRTKVWWHCGKGHSWKAAIRNRNYSNGCTVCANKLLLKGYNHLMASDLKMCKEWDYKNNAPLLPDEVIVNSP